jgi:hypothetical protein
VSLILEALKKLERDKETPDRGFLVMAQMPWVGEGRGRKWLLAAGAVVVLLAAVLAGRWLGSSPVPPAELGPAALAARAGTPAASLPPGPPPSLVRQATPELPPPAAAQAGPAPVLPRYLPPPQRPAFPVSPRAERPRAAGPAPAAAAPPALAPDASAAAAPSGAGALRLEAVSEQDGVAVAVVSGQLVREGDRIGEATVVRIGVQEVEIEVGGHRSLLRF